MPSILDVETRTCCSRIAGSQLCATFSSCGPCSGRRCWCLSGKLRIRMPKEKSGRQEMGSRGRPPERSSLPRFPVRKRRESPHPGLDAARSALNGPCSLLCRFDRSRATLRHSLSALADCESPSTMQMAQDRRTTRARTKTYNNRHIPYRSESRSLRLEVAAVSCCMPPFARFPNPIYPPRNSFSRIMQNTTEKPFKGLARRDLGKFESTSLARFIMTLTRNEGIFEMEGSKNCISCRPHAFCRMHS